MPQPHRTLVFGPAYLDRIVRVDAPLIDPEVGGVVDGSAAGVWLDDEPGLRVVGLPGGGALAIDPPPGWPGPWGTVRIGTGIEGPGRGAGPAPPRSVNGVEWRDDLGGMGAGYARALGGTLGLLVGDPSDPIEARILGLLDREGIAVEPTVVPGRRGEWTLLISSGEHGDKLPIGFRDPGAAGLFEPLDEPCDLLVSASMTNARAASALGARPSRVRLFAPAIRNMRDVEPRISRFSGKIDVLTCNRGEWETLDDREEVAWRVSLLIVTDGPRGAEVRYTTPTGDAGSLSIPAFPRREPPRDTNRAGEAFASTLVSTLLDHDWSPGVTPDDLARVAATRASAASALVLDRVDFGFPTPGEIDRAVSAGVV